MVEHLRNRRKRHRSRGAGENHLLNQDLTITRHPGRRRAGGTPKRIYRVQKPRHIVRHIKDMRYGSGIPRWSRGAGWRSSHPRDIQEPTSRAG